MARSPPPWRANSVPFERSDYIAGVLTKKPIAGVGRQRMKLVPAGLQPLAKGRPAKERYLPSRWRIPYGGIGPSRSPPFSFGFLKAWEAMHVVAPDTCRPFSGDRWGLGGVRSASMFARWVLTSRGAPQSAASQRICRISNRSPFPWPNALSNDPTWAASSSARSEMFFSTLPAGPVRQLGSSRHSCPSAPSASAELRYLETSAPSRTSIIAPD